MKIQQHLARTAVRETISAFDSHEIAGGYAIENLHEFVRDCAHLDF